MKEYKKLSILILIITVISSFIYSKYFNINNKYTLNIHTSNDLIDNVNSYEQIINNIKSEYQNNDIVGILRIENTNYRVPILQKEDNSYYLNHTPDNKESIMGSIYLDYRNNIDTSQKLLIYGHNSSKIDMPFKILEEFYDIDYFNNHKIVSIVTSKAEKKYEIFSVYVEPADYTYMNLNFNSDEDYYNHILKLKEKSMYDTGVEISFNDEVLILQTCSTHKDYSNYEKKYLLIISRRIL